MKCQMETNVDALASTPQMSSLGKAKMATPKSRLLAKLAADNAQRSTLEMEAAAALLMLRYQYERAAGSWLEQRRSPPTPPPPPPSETLLQQLATAPNSDKCTPKEQLRATTVAIVVAPPLKKRSIPPHLLRRSLTPAKNQRSSGIIVSTSAGKPKLRAAAATPNTRHCTKTLLKSCRNMIREFLDNQELA